MEKCGDGHPPLETCNVEEGIALVYRGGVIIIGDQVTGWTGGGSNPVSVKRYY